MAPRSTTSSTTGQRADGADDAARHDRLERTSGRWTSPRQASGDRRRSNLGSAGADVGQLRPGPHDGGAQRRDDLGLAADGRSAARPAATERRPDPDDGPGSGSPVIDAGSAFGLTIDQRWPATAVGLLAGANAGDGSDIGASRAAGLPDHRRRRRRIAGRCRLHHDADAAIHPGAPEVPRQRDRRELRQGRRPIPEIASTGHQSRVRGHGQRDQGEEAARVEDPGRGAGHPELQAGEEEAGRPTPAPSG